MKILTLTCEYPPIGGGGGRVAEGLARALVRSGHEVDLITMGYDRDTGRTVDAGVGVHRVPCLRSSPHGSSPHELATYLFSAVREAGRLLRSKSYDLVHTHFILPDGAATYLVARKADVPYVLTAHGSDVPAYNPNRFGALHALARPFWERIVGAAAELVSPSDHLRELIGRRTDREVRLIPNGLEADFVRPRERRDRIVLVVARLVERKGIETVVEAWPREIEGWALHVVGDGPERESIQRRAAERGVPIRMHGWLDRDSPAFRDLYERSQVFVLPSSAENFPVVLLEAMAAGHAIITSSTTGCREVVGDTGLLVEPGNTMALQAALRSLLLDDAQRQRRGSAARARFDRRFTWDRVADQYLDVYDDAIAGGGRRVEAARA